MLKMIYHVPQFRQGLIILAQTEAARAFLATTSISPSLLELRHLFLPLTKFFIVSSYIRKIQTGKMGLKKVFSYATRLS